MRDQNPLAVPETRVPKPPSGPGSGNDSPGRLEIPEVARIGRVLAFQTNCNGCVCPLGACSIFLVGFGIAISLAAWGVTNPDNDIEHDVNPNTDGFAPRGRDISNRLNTLNIITKQSYLDKLCEAQALCFTHSPPSTGLPEGVVTVTVTDGEGRRRAQDSKKVEKDVCSPCEASATVVFEARDEHNLLTPAGVRAMCQWTLQAEALLSDICQQLPSGGCCKSPSIPQILAKLADKSDCSHLSLNDAELNRALSQLKTDSSVSDLLSSDFSSALTHKAAEATSRYAKMSMCMRKTDDAVRKKHLRKMYFDVALPAYTDDQNPVAPMMRDPDDLRKYYVYQDLEIAGCSFVLIFVYLVLTTQSIWISAFGMLHIFLSYFVSYALYKAAISWFPFLAWLGLFVIAGIGADDIFVYMDAWRQSKTALPHETPLEARVSWVFRRAASAMLITSFTTASAFLSNTVNYVTPIRLFGGFMALLVTVNYLLVITVFPATVMIYSCWFEDRKWSRCLRSSRREREEMETFAMEFRVMEEELHLEGATASKGCGIGAMIDGVFAHYWAPAIWKGKIPIVVFFSAFAVAVGGIYGMHLSKATKAVDLWPEDFMFDKYDRSNKIGWPLNYSTHYGCEPHCEDIYFVFGLEPVDNGDRLDFNDYGSLVLDPNFALSPAAQTWLESFANAVRLLPEPIGTKMTNNHGPVSPLEIAKASCTVGHHSFSACFDAFTRGAATQGSPLPTVLYEGKKLVAIIITAHSVLDNDINAIWDYATRSAAWAQLNTFMAASLQTAPLELQSGFAIAGGFVGMDLQDSMVLSAVESTCISLSVAMGVLLVSTNSLVVSVLALVCICVILTLVLSCLVFLGWELGVIESMCATISVGICVDFICHHAHSYTHGDAAGRYERVRFSLTEMGNSVWSSAITTFSAACVLSRLTKVTFFSEFGTFLAVCIACSTVVALTYFHALLAIFGPAEPNRLTQRCCRCFKKRSELNTEAAEHLWANH